MKQARPAAWPLLLALALLLGATATLLWLRGRLVRQEQSTLDDAVRLFEGTDVLGRPENRQVRFEAIDQLASAFLARDLLVDIRVTKSVLGRGEVTLHPFSADLSEPDWRTRADWEKKSVGSGPDGWLYFRVDRTGRHAVDGVVAAFAALFVAGLGAILLRQRGSEVLLSRTVGELEERRAEVIRLERLALAGQLSANILHDLKKPILNIKHEVDDAIDSKSAPDADLLPMLRQQTDLFLQMIRDLGFEDFVRSDGDQAEWCDISEAIARSLRLVRYERRDVVVSFDPPESMPLVFAVPHRLVQLYSNIALNAFQAMEGKGDLRIEVSRVGSSVVATFEDTGPGIAPEVRPRLFTAFATTRGTTGGSGLGLYICQKIATELGGSIVAEECPHGARFRIELPAEEKG